MSKTVNLGEISRFLGRLVREVEAGEEFVITRNGKPVARLVPTGGQRLLTPEQEAAWARSRAPMKEGWPLGAGPLDRDSLHERGR